MKKKENIFAFLVFILFLGILSFLPEAIQNQKAQVLQSFNQDTIVEETQTKLKSLGFYKGEVNGSFDLKTRQAIFDFQKANNLKTNSRLDAPTQKALLGIDLYGEKNGGSSSIVTGVLGGGVFEEFDENLKIINEIHEYYIKKSDGSIEVIPEEFYDHGHDDKKVSARRQNHKEDDRELDHSIFLEENLGNEISFNKETKEFTLLEKSNERDFIVRPGGPGYREGKAAVFLITFEEANIGNVNYNVQVQDQDPNGNILGGAPSNPPVRPAPEDVQSYLFDQDNGQFQKFYNEMSHGKVTYTGDVFGWYEMPGDGDDPEYQGSLGPCTIRNYGASSAQHASFEGKLQDVADYYNVDISLYNTIIILTECDEYGFVGGYASKVPVPILGQGYHYVEIKGHPTRFSFTGPSDYVNFPDYVGILNHEMGHTFGITHSRALDCGDKTLDTNCTWAEYGNPFDRMGYPDGASVFNFYQQDKLEWVNENQILKINQPGSYYIDNLQTENGIIAANINYRGTDRKIFSVEHRKGEGFDSRLMEYSPLFNDVLNGLILYKEFPIYLSDQSGPLFDELFSCLAISISTHCTNIYLSRMIVDPNPTQDSIYDDLKYDAITGNFLDPKTGIEINVTNVTPDGIYFDVNYNLQTLECNYDIPVNQVLTNVSVDTNGIELVGYFDEDLVCLPKAYEISVVDSDLNQVVSEPFIEIINPDESISRYLDFTQVNLFDYLNSGNSYNLAVNIKDLQTQEVAHFPYQGDIYSSCDLPGAVEYYSVTIDGLDFSNSIKQISRNSNSHLVRFGGMLNEYYVDNCGSITINILFDNINISNGLYFSLFPTPIISNLYSNYLSRGLFYVYTNQNTPLGIYDVSFTITNTDTGTSFDFQGQIEIVP